MSFYQHLCSHMFSGLKEKSVVTQGEQDSSVVTEATTADPEPLVAIASQPESSLSKKGKNINFFSFLIYFILFFLFKAFFCWNTVYFLYLFCFFSSTPLAHCVKKGEKYLACVDKYLHIFIFIVFVYFWNEFSFFRYTCVLLKRYQRERLLRHGFCLNQNWHLCGKS